MACNRNSGPMVLAAHIAALYLKVSIKLMGVEKL